MLDIKYIPSGRIQDMAKSFVSEEVRKKRQSEKKTLNTVYQSCLLKHLNEMIFSCRVPL